MVIEAVTFFFLKGDEVIKPPSSSSESRTSAVIVPDILGVGIVLLHWRWLLGDGEPDTNGFLKPASLLLLWKQAPSSAQSG